MTKEQINGIEQYFWETLGILCGGYNGEVDLQILNVIEKLSGKEFIFGTDIAEQLKLTREHVELIQYIICSQDLADYGTSPRGCWLTDKGKVFHEKMKPYYEYLNSFEEK